MEKTPRKLMERFSNLYLLLIFVLTNTFVLTSHVFDQVKAFFYFLL